MKPWLMLAIYSADLIYLWCIPKRFPNLGIFPVIIVIVSFQVVQAPETTIIVQQRNHCWITSSLPRKPLLPQSCHSATVFAQHRKAVMKTLCRTWTCESNISVLLLNKQKPFIKTFYKIYFKSIHRL